MIVSRRRFLQTGLLSGAAFISRLAPFLNSRAQARAADAIRRPPKIVDIERREFLIPYGDYNAQILFRYHGVKLQTRTVYIMKTDTGLEGLGESWGPGPDEKQFLRFLGTSPFDWVNDEEDLPMNMAVYDLMGKVLGVPAWKLIGPKVRDRMPVGAWTVSQIPKAMAGEVTHVSRMGYRWLKYHIDEVQNVVDQTAAMQEVAPKGFRVLYDFNANSTVEAVFPVIRQLERFEIAGQIEDPIQPADREGYRFLRERCRLPILIHHGPDSFMTDGLCDGLIAGHRPIGRAVKTAAIAEHTGTPFMLQQAGGTINQAFQAHEVAVFKQATMAQVNLCHLWADDVTTTTTRVRDGHIAVPTGPGLGVKLDREKLAKYKAAPRPEYPKLLVRIQYRHGPTIYSRHDPHQPGATDNLRFLNRLIKGPVPGPVPAYDNNVRTEFVDPMTFGRFDEIWKQTSDGPFVMSD